MRALTVARLVLTHLSRTFPRRMVRNAGQAAAALSARPTVTRGRRKLGFLENIVHVEQRVYAGKLTTPKGSKGKRTARTIALSPSTVAGIRLWVERFGDLDPRAFLIPSERGSPLTQENVWRRNMLRRLKPAGLEWATFQVMRRANASISRKANIDDKIAADQRGHGLGVRLELYPVSDLQPKIEAATRLESAVLSEPWTSTNSEPPQKTE